MRVAIRKKRWPFSRQLIDEMMSVQRLPFCLCSLIRQQKAENARKPKGERVAASLQPKSFLVRRPLSIMASRFPVCPKPITCPFPLLIFFAAVFRLPT